MNRRKLKMMLSVITTILVVGSLVSCTKKEDEQAKVDANTQASVAEKAIDLEWDAQPTLGIIKGDYYKVEERFRQGHLGVLEVVQNDNKIVEVEFNEMTRPNYYKRYYQDVPKRNSEYNFDMGLAKGAAWIQSVVKVEKQMIEEQRLTGEFDVVSGASNSIEQAMVPLAEIAKGAAWIQSVVKVEKQMIEEQRLTGEFDVVSGASNSIEQAMVPLAEKINAQIGNPDGTKYYAIAEELGGGLTGKLKVLVKDGKIVECRYDEVFANSQDEIEDAELKKYYRLSKYESLQYHEPSRIGFNVQMDELNAKVVETQNMLDLTGLPAIEDTGDYKSSGYTKRNTAWDNYLKLAEKLLSEMKADKVL